MNNGALKASAEKIAVMTKVHSCFVHARNTCIYQWGLTFRWVPRKNKRSGGRIFFKKTAPFSCFKITMSNSYNPALNLIILTHEMGHYLDFTRNPIDNHEMQDILINTWGKSKNVEEREVTAWENAKGLLQTYKIYNYIEPLYRIKRKASLETYLGEK